MVISDSIAEVIRVQACSMMQDTLNGQLTCPSSTLAYGRPPFHSIGYNPDRALSSLMVTKLQSMRMPHHAYKLQHTLLIMDFI